MTIKEAKKILGKEAHGLSDDEILLEMASASLLKEIFFQLYIEKNNSFSSKDVK